MINRFFLIFGVFPKQGFEGLPAVDNVNFSIGVDPAVKGSLEQAYALIDANWPMLPSPLGLTLAIQERPGADTIRLITSFLFIPSYLTLAQRPLINLAGTSPSLLHETANALSDYLAGQGFAAPIINIISDDDMIFHTSASLVNQYKNLLQDDYCHSKNIFYYVSADQDTGRDPLPSATNGLHSTLLLLQQAELEFQRQSPRLYSLILANQALEKNLLALGDRHSGTEMELKNYKQYVEVLRSDHATKELQDYYNHEYEILPLWYKRFGHIVKVLTGKRTFRSLFRHDVKKYKV